MYIVHLSGQWAQMLKKEDFCHKDFRKVFKLGKVQVLLYTPALPGVAEVLHLRQRPRSPGSPEYLQEHPQLSSTKGSKM